MDIRSKKLNKVRTFSKHLVCNQLIFLLVWPKHFENTPDFVVIVLDIYFQGRRTVPSVVMGTRGLRNFVANAVNRFPVGKCCAG